ncbi:phage tail protein [Paenibacillus sp. CAA11]|uniref:distal tail protein Dit n=1 Tax=Paenibacillus sp. CAA11 TaxID=1532905 RepID=UPI000D35E9FF|nr:distal tail protein Dit [Paenibacillus sp. CAA11]AWB45271.1 phage tail protein [Paenibacillus sp. CAA11]
MIYDVCVNGTWLSTLGASLFERHIPVLPAEEENTVKIAGTDGVVDFGSTYSTRQLDLTLEITVAPEEFHRTLAKLARIFNAKRGELTLEFSDMPGKYYRAVYTGTLALDGQIGSRLLDVSLRMNDPWPSGPEQVREVTITRSPESVVISSDADVPAQPVIVLTNTGANTIHGFTITNEYSND